MSNELETCTVQSAVIKFLVIFVQISVGRAVYDSVRKRCEVDKEFGSRKLFFCKTANYSRVLEKSRCKVFPEGPIKEAEYYLAERSGVRIDGEDIVIDDASGGERKLPWTLSVYLKASGVRYKSRAMINCVQKVKSMCECLVSYIVTVPFSIRGARR